MRFHPTASLCQSQCRFPRSRSLRSATHQLRQHHRPVGVADVIKQFDNDLNTAFRTIEVLSQGGELTLLTM